MHANISSPPPHLADGPSTFPLGAPDWLRNFWRWSFAADAASVTMAEFHGALLAAGGCDEDDLRRWSEQLQQRATLEGGANLLAAFHVGVSESLVLRVLQTMLARAGCGAGMVSISGLSNVVVSKRGWAVAEMRLRAARDSVMRTAASLTS